MYFYPLPYYPDMIQGLYSFAVEEVHNVASHLFKPHPAHPFQKLLLTDSQRFHFGFPVQMTNQVMVNPDKYQKQALFYTRNDILRKCTRCNTDFFVEPDGFQPMRPHTVCQDFDGNSYNFHIHTRLPAEHLRQFKRAPMVDMANRDRSGKMFCLDVESVYTSHGQAVGRVTVVDHDGETIIDDIVLPKDVIYDYVTKYSGLTPYHMEFAMESLESIREKILSLLNEESILIGHSLNGDLKALGILHGNVIDTSILFMKNGKRPSLRNLTSQYLGRQIQNSTGGHCSREDVIATLQLVHFAAANPDLLPSDFQ